jgi:hypothetical protein
MAISIVHSSATTGYRMGTGQYADSGPIFHPSRFWDWQIFSRLKMALLRMIPATNIVRLCGPVRLVLVRGNRWTTMPEANRQ